jgi:hypothetical protein
MAAIRSAGVIRAAIAGLATIAVLGLPGPAHAGLVRSNATLAAPPTAPVTVDVNTVNGSGCPAGTATVRMLSDNSGFRVAYRDFVARDGGNAAPTDIRQNCQVNVTIHIPQGFTYAIASADYRGQASLQNGASALHRTNYYFQGSSDNNVFDHVFAGPFRGTWRSSDSTPFTELVFAPCGVDRSLNINTELRVNSPVGASWISMRSSDGDVDTIAHFSWKQC